MSQPAGPPIAADDVSALILAAGEGQRFGQAKAFLDVGGVPLLEAVISRIRDHAGEIIVGVRARDLERAAALPCAEHCRIVAGGATRQDTVAAILGHATRRFALLHEVARPLASPALFRNVLKAAEEHGAAALHLAASPRDSVALAADGFLDKPLPRDRVISLQTPQAFRTELLTEVLALAQENGWNETSVPFLFARAGRPVVLVEGASVNIKITAPEDWPPVRDKLLAENRL